MAVFFEWDPRKAATNAGKHRVTFEEARSTFADPAAQDALDDRQPRQEERFVRVGLSDRGRLIVVVYAEHLAGSDAWVRIISARRATPAETRRYAGRQ